MLSLIVVLGCKSLLSAEAWADWGWRLPFLLSIGLLAISLWMRVKLSESPVFQAMREEGEIAGNPFVESMTYPGNKRRIFIALFGIAAGLTVIWYTAMFSGLTFLKTAMWWKTPPPKSSSASPAAVGMGFYLWAGHLSDKIGRKKPIVWGYALTLLLLFPAYWVIGAHANPGLAAAAERAPVVVSGPACSYNPFAQEQKSQCAILLGDLAGTGVSYELGKTDTLVATVGGKSLPLGAYPWADKAARGKRLRPGWARRAMTSPRSSRRGVTPRSSWARCCC